MKIPFLDFLKKDRARVQDSRSRSANLASKPSPIAKPNSDRLSKTVMPNATRTVAPEETPEAASSALHASTFASPSDAPRTISFSPSRKPVAPRKDLPPAVALALEPRVERAISLELADIVKEMPAGLVKPMASLNSSRRILLKASELEKRMAEGKPTVSLASIYQQVPEIFLESVPISDMTQVALPFDKVLEAFTQMHVRRDQVREQAVPQVATPFLQATLEDNERFGLPSEPIQISELSPVRLEPATAETIAAAEPEPTASEKFIPTPMPAAPPEEPETDVSLRIPVVKSAVENGTSARPNGAGKNAPERIPFQLPPKETGVPASERVPASCGPPVSTPLPSPPEPARIPFQVVPPTPKLGSKPVTFPEPALPEHTPVAEKKISFALKPILQSLPAFELNGDPNEVPDETWIEFPFKLIESQLASGRVVVAPDLFERSLPSDCRRFFTAKNLQMPVPLPLQEVLKNLPLESLRMRDDQEERETGEQIETPFSTTAAEDVKRFNQTTVPIAKPESTPAAEEIKPAAAPELDVKSVIAQAMQLPGVRACSVSFTDGLSLAGNLPPEIGADGLCAVAPSLLQRIETHLLETKIGELTALTLHCTKSTVTFFQHANICLAALHTNGELTAAVRSELCRMLKQLSGIYSQPEVTHVDH